MPLARLFDDPSAAPRPVFRPGERIAWRDPVSGYVWRNISPANFPSPLQIVEVELPAGARVAYETARVTSTFTSRSGSSRVEVTVGSVAHRLCAGDCLAMRLDTPIAFRNRTHKAARYVVVLTSAHSRAWT